MMIATLKDSQETEPESKTDLNYLVNSKMLNGNSFEYAHVLTIRIRIENHSRGPMEQSQFFFFFFFWGGG